MSIYIRQNVYVTVNQLEGESAREFSAGPIYEILGIHTPSESARAF